MISQNFDVCKRVSPRTQFLAKSRSWMILIQTVCHTCTKTWSRKGLSSIFVMTSWNFCQFLSSKTRSELAWKLQASSNLMIAFHKGRTEHFFALLQSRIFWQTSFQLKILILYAKRKIRNIYSGFEMHLGTKLTWSFHRLMLSISKLFNFTLFDRDISLIAVKR